MTVESVRRPARGPGSAGINLEHIVRATIRMGERDGFENLSMRRLAAELKVGVMTVYRYVDNKQDLLDAVVDWYLGQRLEIVEIDGPWDEQVISVFRALHDLMLAEPALAQAAVARPLDVTAVYRLAEAVLEPLIRAGFPEHEAVNVFRRLHSYTLGFTINKITHARPDAPSAAARTERLQRLPVDSFPTVLRVASHWGDWNSEELFEDGLRQLLTRREDVVRAE